MGTSRSGDWVAEALLFSGRPNPRWSVGDAAVGDLLAAWDRLPPRRSPAAAPPPLGYRGCALRAPDGRVWRATAATVTLFPPARTAGLDEVVRDDAGRAFERRVLRTAPPGLLPRFAVGPDPDPVDAGGAAPEEPEPR